MASFNRIKQLSAPLAAITLLLLCRPSLAGCGDDYMLDTHYISGKLDICTIEDEIAFEVLTNFGTKPEWINDTQFVFLNNQVGDVFLMDLELNTLTNLTGHFSHAGFTRIHQLNNGDLLLLGPETGSQPPADPLVINEAGRFTGSLWVFEAPFHLPPYLLKREKIDYLFGLFPVRSSVSIPGWEGIAVSKESDTIVWSDTQVPFFGNNLLDTAFNYLFAPSSLWAGELVYSPGQTRVVNARKIVDKIQIGSVLLEPQDFRGDHQLTFTAYGPTASGSGDTYLYDFNTRRATRRMTGPGYEEWEGMAPDYSRSFVEIDRDASNLEGPISVELFLHDFASGQSTRFSYFHDDYQRDDDFKVHQPVFSPDGTQALFATGSSQGNEIRSPGYGIGIVILRDVAAYLETVPPQ